MRANKNQLRAINAQEGAHLVIASAGSGKTYTIIQRSIMLINKGLCKPHELLLLTFSRKAADELKNRIAVGLQNGNTASTASTFHSFCLQFILKRKMKSVTVLDEVESKTIVSKIIQKRINSLYGIPSSVVYKIFSKSAIASSILHPDVQQQINDIREEYALYKRHNNCIDYEDMINVSIEYLNNDRILQSEIRGMFRYVMVDEYQDTSDNNFRLLKLLLPEDSPNVFMVGDDWQSIYAFRNANIDYIVHVKKYFKNITIHSLNTNYRSKKEIVGVSNRLIAKNTFRSRRFIKALRGRGGKVLFYKALSFEDEAAITATIQKKHEQDHSIGVLYRNNWQGAYLQKMLDNQRNTMFMTIHSAKGLEFDTVIICGVKDRLLPDPYTDIEEERRLMYVALTRAKNYLHIIYHPAYDAKKPQFIEECENYF